VRPEGKETIAGNLCGFHFQETQWDKQKTIQSKGYSSSFLLNDLCSQIMKIIAIGEKEKYTIENASNFNLWFGPDKEPTSIKVDKRTLNILGFLLSDNNWVYIVSNGKNDYYIQFECGDEPMKFVENFGYREMGMNLKILNEIV
jgi:hypothetical protein